MKALKNVPCQKLAYQLFIRCEKYIYKYKYIYYRYIYIIIYIIYIKIIYNKCCIFIYVYIYINYIYIYLYTVSWCAIQLLWMPQFRVCVSGSWTKGSVDSESCFVPSNLERYKDSDRYWIWTVFFLFNGWCGRASLPSPNHQKFAPIPMGG